MSPIYLDHAATTPIDDRVLAAMQPFLTTQFYNPSAQYSAGRLVRTSLEKARGQVAQTLGASPSEIIFTAGGTEANNVAIHGVMRQHSGAELLISSIEHAAVSAPAADYQMKMISVTADGRLDLDDAANKITDSTVLISCMYANNEIGTVQPIRALARLVQQVRRTRLNKGLVMPLYLHIDACQAPNYLDVHVARLGIDLMTLNGSKIYGPKQSGVLYIKRGIVLKPLISGGGQEHGLRSGTENVAASVGFATALDIAAQLRNSEAARLEQLQNKCLHEIQEQLPQAQVNGSMKYRLPNNVHLTLPGTDNERLLLQLDELAIMAAAGSACSASSQLPSSVLRALGLDDETAQSSIRFTMGRSTTEADVNHLVSTLKRLVTA